ncbi:hypothetical protein ACEQPO_15930 [Bacillus sp. SL00103]
MTLRPLHMKLNSVKQGIEAATDQTLESGGDFQWRKNGVSNIANPKTIHTLRWACRNEDYDLFKAITQS